MTLQARALLFTACCTLFFLLCGFGSGSASNVGADILVTAAPSYDPLAALRGQERFPHGAQLLLIHNGKSEPFLQGFAATADANISFDATHVLFAGKKTADALWQIYELTLAGKSIRPITSGNQDAIRPLYLPGDRFVYAQRTPAGFQLRAESLGDPENGRVHQEMDRSALQLTYADGDAIPSDVLADGRILFESDYPLGSGGSTRASAVGPTAGGSGGSTRASAVGPTAGGSGTTAELFLVYSDGSGIESYRCDHGLARWGGRQLTSGDVVFTHGTSLARFTSPLAHEERIAAPAARYAGPIAEMKDPTAQETAWLVSAKTASEAHYALKLLKPGSSKLQPILSDAANDLVDPVLIAPRVTPRRHPSALHPWDYANLLALNARISRDGALNGSPASVRVETKDAGGHPIALGSSPIEPDGSYFIKIPGDKPIRFAVLDSKGNILRQERGWFWARAGEQRYCVGCHAGPEHAPDNRIPAALVRSTAPIDLTGSTAPPLSAGGR